MPKFPLEINRKLKKLNCQSIKVLRRGLQIKSANITEQNPYSLQTNPQYDFALGTYEIKPSSEYTLILNLDLPKRTSQVTIDIWGLTSNHHLQQINQGRVNIVNRDAKVKFHTYPKSRYVFLTFRIQPDEDYTPDQGVTWSLNYIYIETNTSISKLAATPAVPSKILLKYNIECAPHTIERLELSPSQIYKELIEYLPIQMDIHEHSLIKYLLCEETTPAYITALKANMKISKSTTQHTTQHTTQNPADRNNSNEKQSSDQLIENRKKIMMLSKDLEEILGKVDNILLHKNNLETSLDQTEDTIPIQKEKHENYMRLLQKLLDGLALKSNHIKTLKSTCNQPNDPKDKQPNPKDKQPNPKDKQPNKLEDEEQKNVNLVLDYYLRRIQTDRKILEQSYQEAEMEWKVFHDETLRPIEGKQSTDQGKLDNLLVHYRTLKKDTLKIKEELDQLIVRFMIDWYQLIRDANSIYK
ncbi:MAG: hypothetical protein WD512_15015 [Candidatus Paceibacterota bacterium]